MSPLLFLKNPHLPHCQSNTNALLDDCIKNHSLPSDYGYLWYFPFGLFRAKLFPRLALGILLGCYKANHNLLLVARCRFQLYFPYLPRRFWPLPLWPKLHWLRVNLRTASDLRPWKLLCFPFRWSGCWWLRTGSGCFGFCAFLGWSLGSGLCQCCWCLVILLKLLSHRLQMLQIWIKRFRPLNYLL